MKKSHKLLSLLLVLSLLLTSAPLSGLINFELPDWSLFKLFSPVSKSAENVQSGKCGKNVYWTLDKDGLFTVSGTGPMLDYVEGSTSSEYKPLRPWRDTSITKVVIKSGVTCIGENVFYGCTELSDLTIPDSVTSVGRGAFDNTAWYNAQPDGVIYVGKVAYKYKGKMPENTNILLKAGTIAIEECAFKDYDSLTSVTIPNGVMRIGARAFELCQGLTSVTIPNSVTSIGDHAFSSCRGLTSVTIPNSVTSIGDGAFGYCSGLTSVTIPDGVTSIGNQVFRNCIGLESVTIPNGVTSIGDAAFSDCTGLMSITIPNGVITIGDYAFYKCSKLKNVAIPVCVTNIGNYAFSYCTSLTSLTIPNSVLNIGDSAFSRCEGLTSVTIGSSVTSIGDSAFYACMEISSVIIPDSVRTIGNSAFDCCSELTNLIIGNSVTSIGDGAFRGCWKLTSVTIPDSVTSIGSESFRQCTGLKSVIIGDGMASIGKGAFYCCKALTSVIGGEGLTSIGYQAFSYTAVHDTQPYGVLYIGKVACGYKGIMPENTVLTFEEGTKGIAEWAFYDCRNMTAVTIPDSVISIGSGAFGSCTGVKKVTIGSNAAYQYSVFTKLEEVVILDTVTEIPASAFYYCTGLTNVTIPDSVTSIGSYAFSCCTGLTNVTIPDSVTSIGSSAFSDCTGLTNISIPDSVTSIENNAFFNTAWYNTQSNGLVYAGKVAYKYKGTMPTNTSIQLKEGTVEIADSAFFSCKNLASVMIPNSVTRIGNYAFSECTGLKSIIIPNSVMNIGNWVFQYCTGLTSVTIPNSITSIGNSAFYNCKGLTSVTIPDSVTNIGEKAFYDCTGLISVMIPNSVTSIGDSAFEDCRGMTNVTIPDSVTNIGDGAFQDCTGMTSVTIPDSVTRIGNRAFYGCKLTNVTISNSVKSIGECAFRCNLHDVYYYGSQEEWDSIEISAGNYNLLLAELHFISYLRFEVYGDDSVAKKGKTYSPNPVTLVAYLKNDGQKTAKNITVSIETDSRYFDIAEENRSVSLGTLSPGEEKQASFSLKVKDYTGDADVESIIRVTGDNISVEPIHKTTMLNVKRVDNRIKFGLYYTGIDNLSFINHRDNFYDSKKTGENYYHISQEYLDLLTQDMAPTVKNVILREKTAAWGGSCYGMSTVVTLAKLGRISPKKWDGKNDNANSLPKPIKSEICSSLINFYQLSQWLPDLLSYAKTNFIDQSKVLQSLVENVKKVKDGGAPVVVCYGWETTDGEINGHAILAYDITEKSGDKDYKYKIYVYDPNYYYFERGSLLMSPNYLYVKEDFSDWKYGEMKTTGGDDNSKNAVVSKMLYLALSDVNLMNLINPETKENHTVLKKYAQNMVIDWTAKGFSAAAAGKTAVVSGLKSTGDFDIHVDVLGGITADGSGSSDLIGYLPDYDSFTITPTKESDVNIDMILSDYGASVEADRLQSFTMTKQGVLQTDGIKGAYEVSLTADGEAGILGYPQARFSGTDAGTLRIIPSADGLIVESDKQTDLSVTLSDFNTEKTLELDNTDASVMIKENKGHFGVYADRDKNGSYETPLGTVDDRIPGDVSGDGQVTAEDARLALRAAVGLENYAEGSAEFLAADATKDGAITAEDARLILRAAVGLETLS